MPQVQRAAGAAPDELRSIVQKMIDAGEPEAAIASVIKSYNAVEPVPSHEQTAPPEPTFTDKAIESLPMIGGALGAMTGVGLPGSALMAVVGGAGGEGWRQAIQTARGKERPRTTGQAVNDISMEGAKQGALEVGGQGASAGLRTIGNGMARAGALPIKSITKKYGSIGQLITENRVPVTKSGLAKAGRLKTAARGVKASALEEAQQRGLRPGQHVASFVDDALAKATPYAEKARKAGLPDAAEDFAARGRALVKNNDEFISLNAADDIKSTIDDTLGPAYRKLKAKEALTPSERMEMELSHAISRAQEAAVPNYRALNKDVMDKAGLERAIADRLSGSNQGLENLATAMIGPAAIPARIAMLPGVASTAGIGTHMAGEYPKTMSNALRAALLALMSSHEQESR